MAGPKSAAEILGVENMDVAESPTFQGLLERLYTEKFQGVVVLHFAGGLPRRVEFPQPVQIALNLDAPGRRRTDRDRTTSTGA